METPQEAFELIIADLSKNPEDYEFSQHYIGTYQSFEEFLGSAEYQAIPEKPDPTGKTTYEIIEQLFWDNKIDYSSDHAPIHIFYSVQ